LAPRTALPPAAQQAQADFYLPYAVLAADVYRTGGQADALTAMAMVSPWLRAEVDASGDPAVKDRYRRQAFPDAERAYREIVRRRCVHEQAAADPGADPAALSPSCQAEADLQELDADALSAAEEETIRFLQEEPSDAADCAYNRGHEPKLPVAQVARDNHWTRVPELQKQAAVRGWRLFVPELAIDVWRRERSQPGQPRVMEYAIVYRGTVGGGGWMSNLRGLTALTPLVWDQYRQAREATAVIIAQIDRLHTLADSLLSAREPTRVLFTAVGHSLGGGLAQYVYLRNPRITRVIGFDPSPIDGASIIPVEARPAVTAHGKRQVDTDPYDHDAAIFLLFEHRSVMSLVTPCQSGPIWGAEGGPSLRCDVVDYSHGNIMRQHNMAQLACKLFLASSRRSP
ncbi:MAG: hypothetical protein WAQ05_26005, partial [Rubrivivax sp.]